MNYKNNLSLFYCQKASNFEYTKSPALVSIRLVVEEDRCYILLTEPKTSVLKFYDDN